MFVYIKDRPKNWKTSHKIVSYREVVRSKVIVWKGKNYHAIFMRLEETAQIARKRGWVDITAEYNAAKAKPEPKPEPQLEAKPKPKKTTRRRIKKSE